MKAVMLYHPNSEFSRLAEQYVYDFEQSTSKKVEAVSLETIPGAAMAKLYDVVRYPAVLVIRDNGELVKGWQGENLPLINEVAGYLQG